MASHGARRPAPGTTCSGPPDEAHIRVCVRMTDFNVYNVQWACPGVALVRCAPPFHEPDHHPTPRAHHQGRLQPRHTLLHVQRPFIAVALGKVGLKRAQMKFREFSLVKRTEKRSRGRRTGVSIESRELGAHRARWCCLESLRHPVTPARCGVLWLGNACTAWPPFGAASGTSATCRWRIPYTGGVIARRANPTPRQGRQEGWREGESGGGGALRGEDRYQAKKPGCAYSPSSASKGLQSRHRCVCVYMDATGRLAAISCRASRLSCGRAACLVKLRAYKTYM